MKLRVTENIQSGVVYKITSLINGKIYTGRDLRNNKYYLGGGIATKAAVRKYGRENFVREIIEVCNAETLSEREIFWIKELDARNPLVGYNISKSGETGDAVKKYGESITGMTFDEIHGKDKANKIRARMSEKASIKWKDSAFTEKMSTFISKGKMGVKLTNLHCQHISEGKMGHSCSDELKEKLSVSNRAAVQMNSVQISATNIDTGEEQIFNSIQNACRAFCISQYDVKYNKVNKIKFKRLNEPLNSDIKNPGNTYDFFLDGTLVDTVHGKLAAIKYCRERKLKHCLLVLKVHEIGGTNEWKNWKCSKRKFVS